MTAVTHLHIRVSLYGAIVEERLVKLTQVVRLGEHDEALVHFPGADLLVRSTSGCARVRGRTLMPGDRLTMELGSVRLALEAIGDEPLTWLPDPRRLRRRVEHWFGGPVPLPDLRLLMATAAVALMGGFLDTVSSFVQTHPVASEQLETMAAQWRGLDRDGPRTAAVEAPDSSDDAATEPADAPVRPAADVVEPRPPARFRAVAPVE